MTRLALTTCVILVASGAPHRAALAEVHPDAAVLKAQSERVAAID